MCAPGKGERIFDRPTVSPGKKFELRVDHWGASDFFPRRAISDTTITPQPSLRHGKPQHEVVVDMGVAASYHGLDGLDAFTLQLPDHHLGLGPVRLHSRLQLPDSRLHDERLC